MGAGVVPVQPLSRDRVEPLYSQLAADLQHLLDGGQWQPGQMIPSEAELGQLYGVSRVVVRQALDSLERSGSIHRVKGKGGIVLDRKLAAYLMQDMGGFAANMAGQGFTVDTEVLEKEMLPASPAVAAALCVPEGSQVLKLERLRFVRGEPLFLGVTHLPGHLGHLLLNEDLANKSLSTFLAQRANLVLSEGVRVIEAVAAGRREAEMLKVRVGAPLFRFFAVSYAEEGVPVECSQVWLRGDRLAFRVRLGCHPDAPSQAGANR